MTSIDYSDCLKQIPANSPDGLVLEAQRIVSYGPPALPPFTGRLSINVPIRYPPSNFQKTSNVLLLPIRKLTIPFVDKVNNHSFTITFGHGLNIQEVRAQLLSDQSLALLLVDTGNNSRSELLYDDSAALSKVVSDHDGESKVQLVAGRTSDLEQDLYQLRGLPVPTINPHSRQQSSTMYANNSLQSQFEQGMRPRGAMNLHGGYTQYR